VQEIATVPQDAASLQRNIGKVLRRELRDEAIREISKGKAA
jgi:hypothetical protein